MGKVYNKILELNIIEKQIKEYEKKYPFHHNFFQQKKLQL
mgnify:CR=1 FL=1